MAVKFVIGRAGAGKTKYCLDRISQAVTEQPLGPAIYWIVPRQATFLAERALAAETGRSGYFRARSLDFQDLGNSILAECGGTAVPEISDLGRRMILGHLLRQLEGELRYFQDVAHQPGVAAQLSSTFGELQRAGHEALAMDEMLAADAASPALHAKVHDLVLIYDRYAKFLGQERIDPIRRLSESIASIDRCRSLRQADVYIDAFYDFTAAERKLIAALAKVCRSVTITLTIDARSATVADANRIPDDMSLFNRSEQAYRRLYFELKEAGCEIDKPLLLGEPRRFCDSSLKKLEAGFVEQHSTTYSTADARDGGSIHLIKAPDHASEVDAVARWIRLQVDGGLRYRDIVVLMRSLDDYHPLIEASFPEHNIPFFVDRRRSASHHPLLRLIRAGLGIATTNYSHDAMMSAIKTELVDLSGEEADALENYALQHGIDHTVWTSPNNWTGNRPAAEEQATDGAGAAGSGNAPAQQMDALRRRLIERLEPFAVAMKDKQASVRSRATAIFRLLEDFRCHERIVGWMEQATEAGRIEEAAEHQRVWEEVVKLFDEMVELFGDEAITLSDFSAIVDSALEAFDLALAPPTLDQVLVGSVDRTRTPEVAACAILGMSEGQFPRTSHEDSIFTDADRRALSRQSIDLEPDTARRLLDENFLAYIALSRASRHLLITSRSCGADGRTLGESPLWMKVREILPGVSVSTVPRAAELPVRLIATPRQLIGSLMRRARDGAGEDEHFDAVYQWLANYDGRGDGIDNARFGAWKALSYVNDARLESGRGERLFASPLRISAWQIESFRMCPFQHFARHGLGLKPRQRRQVGPQDLSRVFHDVMEQLVKELLASEQSWDDMGEAEVAAKLSRLTEQIARRMRDELMLSSARNRYLLGHIEKTLALVTASQRAAAGRGEFRPKYVNLTFGSRPTDKMKPLEIKTPAGNTVLLSGRIDRVDVTPGGDACVVDYRLGARPLDAAGAFHGFGVQLLSYLLLLEKLAPELGGDKELRSAAAFCVQMMRSIRPGNPAQAPSPEDEAFHLQVKPRGIFDLRVAALLDKALTSGLSSVVNYRINKDGNLGRPNDSDAAASEDFAALLAHVERRIGELADEMVSGRIEIRPYRLGTETPCPRCEFRAVCRFEPSPGCYDDIEPLSREEMFRRIGAANGRPT